MKNVRDEIDQVAHKQASSSVLKALDVIEALVDSGGSVSLAELSLKLGRPASSIHRLLRTLELRRWVESEGGRYRLTLKVFEAGMSVVERLDMISESRDVCTRLRDEFNETVNVAIRSGVAMIYVAKYERQPPMRLISHLGLHVPLHCTAMGKAVLSVTPEPERGALLARLDFEARTDNTITTLGDLVADLERTAERGWALDNEEFEPGLVCMGAAVLDHDGVVAGAISVTGSARRVPAAVRAQRGERVRAAADEVSQRLGYRPQREDRAAEGARRWA